MTYLQTSTPAPTSNTRDVTTTPRDVTTTPRDVITSPRDITTTPRDVTTTPRDVSPLSSLPNELLLHIISYCSATQLHSLSRTNRALRSLATLPHLWARLCKRDYNLNISSYSLRKTTQHARVIYLQFLHLLGSPGGQLFTGQDNPWLANCRIELNLRDDQIIWTNCRKQTDSKLPESERKRDMFCLDLRQLSNESESESEGFIPIELKCMMQEKDHDCEPRLYKTRDNKTLFSSTCLIPVVGCTRYFF